MVGLCTLDDLLEQVEGELYLYDKRIIHLVHQKKEEAERALSEFDIGDIGHHKFRGIVFLQGSTHPFRRTYVIDPRGPEIPFPPDLDLHVYVDKEFLEDGEIADMLGKSLVERLAGSSRDPLFDHKDHRLRRRLYPLGPVNLSVCVHELEENEDPEPKEYIIYSHERPVVRAFKMLAERSGLYGGTSNLAFAGLGCEIFTVGEEVGREYYPDIDIIDHEGGTLDRAIRRLGTLARMPKKQRAKILRQSYPFLTRMSRFAWQRAELAADRYEKTGKVRASPFGMEDWLAFNEQYREGGFEAFMFTTACAPGAPHCGIEASDIARALCKAYPGGKGFDYYVVPHQGNPGQSGEGGRAHTDIYVRFVPEPGVEAESILEATQRNLFGVTGRNIKDGLIFR